MKCPHCPYEHEPAHYSEGKWIDAVGYYPFFESPVQMEQKMEYNGTERKTLYACPECGKAFIEV